MAISHQFPFAVGMVLLYIIVGHALERYRQAGRGGHCCAHESVPAVLLGMLVGAVLRWGLDERVPFSADVFFFFVLPPIIFAQGYMLRGRNFFDNFYHIFAFGIMGTLLQFVILTSIASGCSGLVSAFGQGGRIQFNVLECLVLAAVLSPSDEVAVLSLVKPETFPQLGAILFGEGVLNDALSIVLFRAVFNMLGKAGDAAATQAGDAAAESISTSAITRRLAAEAMYLLALAVVLGLAGGLALSLLFRRMPSLRRHPTRQMALVMLSGYLVYGVSEAANMSGITALFFAAWTMSHYAWHSMSHQARSATRIAFESMANMAEAFAFAYLGLSCFSLPGGGGGSDGGYDFSLGFTLLMLFAVIFARAVAVVATVLVGRALSPGRWPRRWRRTAGTRAPQRASRPARPPPPPRTSSSASSCARRPSSHAGRRSSSPRRPRPHSACYDPQRTRRTTCRARCRPPMSSARPGK